MPESEYGERSRGYRPIPPLRQALIRKTRTVRVVRRVIEEHEACAHRVPEVHNIQAGGRLVEAVAETPRIERKKAAQDEAQGGLVRNNQYLIAAVCSDDLADHGQRAGQYCKARFPSKRCERERIRLPCGVLGSEPAFDVVALQAFPVPMSDFSQPIARDGIEPAVPRDDSGRLQCPRQRTGIDGGDVLLREALAQARGLSPAFIRQFGSAGPREAVLLRGSCRSVSYEEQTGDSHRVHCLATSRR